MAVLQACRYEAQLHGNGRLAKWHLRQALDVTYPLHHDWLSEGRRMVIVTNNVIPNLTTPAGYRRNHTLTEFNEEYISQVSIGRLWQSRVSCLLTCELSYVPYSHLMFTSISYRIKGGTE